MLCFFDHAGRIANLRGISRIFMLISTKNKHHPAEEFAICKFECITGKSLLYPIQIHRIILLIILIFEIKNINLPE